MLESDAVKKICPVMTRTVVYADRPQFEALYCMGPACALWRTTRSEWDGEKDQPAGQCGLSQAPAP